MGRGKVRGLSAVSESVSPLLGPHKEPASTVLGKAQPCGFMPTDLGCAGEGVRSPLPLTLLVGQGPCLAQAEAPRGDPCCCLVGDDGWAAVSRAICSLCWGR